MRRWLKLNRLMLLGVLLVALSGCGGSDGSGRPPLVGPGLVGIDDRPTVAITAPQLTVEYIQPGGAIFSASILSDQPTDGDIAFAVLSGSFTITQGPDTLLFGIDSASPNQPEYRAFLDFPLDGSTGEPAIPLNAIILSATLTIFVDFVDYTATVPVLLDLVEYSVFAGLVPDDFSSAPLEFLAFDIYNSDAGRDVPIDVTLLMREAQDLALADFQVRFLLDL